jgi:N-acetylmuramoyl-L-alanine amidase
MRLYRLGDEGAAVRDIQDRLDALGYPCDPDLRSLFGDGTHKAVKGFQKARGLGVDGIVGPDTWRTLYEAGYRLGDRMMFLRRPMIRGEDVSELQSRLSSLGFDPGKVDGVFGPQTEKAVIEFQHNRDLAEDGKAGPEVVTEIHLVTRGEMKEGRQGVREREWLRRLPPTVAGARVYLDAGCRDAHEATVAWDAASATALGLQEKGGLPVMSRSQDASLPERLRARRANVLGSDLIVAFQVNPDGEDYVFYFASEHGTSAAGELLARSIAAVAGGQVEGRASAMLKETRAPAAVVSRGKLDEEVGYAVADGLITFFTNAAATR